MGLRLPNGMLLIAVWFLLLNQELFHLHQNLKEARLSPSRPSLYKCVAVDMMIAMVMFLLFNLLQIADLAELFNDVREDIMYIVCMIHFNHLEIFYKMIKWLMLILASILWIGLMVHG